MEHIAPLLQTVLWVGLLGAALWRFHQPIHGLLVALQKRVEGGSNVKVGSFEITGQLRPQDPSKQKEKVASELAEVLQGPPDAEPVMASSTVSQRASVFRANYFQAEDLVLRAIQAEYGATVSRQVTAGTDMGFDGAFVTNGRLNIVEVKYLSGSDVNLPNLRKTVDRIAGAISRYGWRNAQIILAIVLQNAEQVSTANERLQSLVSESQVPIVVRCYSFSDLQQKFGISGADN